MLTLLKRGSGTSPEMPVLANAAVTQLLAGNMPLPEAKESRNTSSALRQIKKTAQGSPSIHRHDMRYTSSVPYPGKERRLEGSR